jgi:hypothetical protein
VSPPSPLLQHSSQSFAASHFLLEAYKYTQDNPRCESTRRCKFLFLFLETFPPCCARSFLHFYLRWSHF